MKIKCLCLVIFSFMALGIVSCSSHSDGASFTSRLDSIDVFIAQGSTESAVKALKKLEKKPTVPMIALVFTSDIPFLEKKFLQKKF